MSVLDVSLKVDLLPKVKATNATLVVAQICMDSHMAFEVTASGSTVIAHTTLVRSDACKCQETSMLLTALYTAATAMLKLQ